MNAYQMTISPSVDASTDDGSTHQAVMRGLDSKLDGLARLIPRGSPVVYLDYPVHFNVGDLLINLGTERYFQRMGHRVVARMSLHDLCKFTYQPSITGVLRPAAARYIERTDPNSILVLHGGGNFGDLYPDFQVMRELVVAHFSGRRIVMLPQSAHFRTFEAARTSISRILAHGDVHLCFRDKESMDLVDSVGAANLYMFPDMAHALVESPEILAHANNGGSGVLRLQRNDLEQVHWGAAVEARTALDWSDLVTAPRRVSERALIKLMSLSLDPGFSIPSYLWYQVRDGILADAFRLFSSHAGVVTDRLHGMLLASLLRRRVTYIDNSYGKLSRYAAAWLGESPLIRSTRDE